MKKEHINLSAEEILYLENLLQKGEIKVRKYRRAQSLLLLDQGFTFQEVSNQLGVSYPAVHGWAKKYRKNGLSFLDEKARSGRPSGISGEERAKITSLACSTPPDGYARWSLRLLADRVVELGLIAHISHNHVGKILKKMNFNLTENASGVSEK